MLFLVGLPYFSSKPFDFFGIRVVGMFSCHPLPIVDRIFFCCSGKICFVCIVLAFVDIFLISLPSPALSGLFPQVVLFFLVLPFPFSSRIFWRLSFVLTSFCFNIFFRFQSNFPSWFRLFLRAFWGDPNFLTNGYFKLCDFGWAFRIRKENLKPYKNMWIICIR